MASLVVHGVCRKAKRLQRAVASQMCIHFSTFPMRNEPMRLYSRSQLSLSPMEKLPIGLKLLLLSRFDIVQGFPVDYMHAVCEVLTEKLTNL